MAKGASTSLDWLRFDSVCLFVDCYDNAPDRQLNCSSNNKRKKKESLHIVKEERVVVLMFKLSV